MDYRILGPLEIRGGGQQPLPLGGAKQRALLALLLLNANRAVPRRQLIDDLWGDDPPKRAVAAVQVYVSRLRKLLPSGVLVTRPPGYLLRVWPGELDLERFERLRAEGRLHDALALWRGAPLAELGEPFARVEAGRLEDIRLAVLEERIETDLAHGRHTELVGELETLTAGHPHRERWRAQLMLALYRSGRQADALAAYRDARRTLNELGLEPSERLRRLEQQILTHDAALEQENQPLPSRGAVGPVPGPPRPTPTPPAGGRVAELSMPTAAPRVAAIHERAFRAYEQAMDRHRRAAALHEEVAAFHEHRAALEVERGHLDKAALLRELAKREEERAERERDPSRSPAPSRPTSWQAPAIWREP